MRRVSDEEVANVLNELDGWTVEEEKWLRKRYRFPEFLKGIAFVNDIAKLSEEVKHHPFISIDYKVVTLKLTSWRMKGITDLDLELIQKYDDLYRKQLGSDAKEG
ncbi:4a-hydroxytetrahydrobiopterin dehydratase [Tuberibacillus calidus]|uniref:4a-hydroxytetrahydrobiopterin dehydratase n=1 Tax=Tuberibacillus calidus TaxID=340097 RepID=UPI0003FF1E3C|nr:4a-hydroxytetrahydrobiopterin dehydratase [Tuberibacillus calidus]